MLSGWLENDEAVWQTGGKWWKSLVFCLQTRWRTNGGQNRTNGLTAMATEDEPECTMNKPILVGGANQAFIQLRGKNQIKQLCNTTINANLFTFDGFEWVDNVLTSKMWIRC